MTVRSIFGGQATSSVGRLSYVTYASTYQTTSSTATSVTIPATSLTDDILVVSISVTNTTTSTPPGISTPTGYTVVNSIDSNSTAAGDGTRTACFTKLVKPSDIGATLSISHGSADIRTILVLIFRNSVNGPGAFTVQTPVNSFGSTGSISTPPNQIVTASATSKPCAVIAVYAFSGARVFTGSPRLDLASGPLSVYHCVYNSSPSDVTVGCTPNSTTVTMQSFYFTVP